MKIPNKRELQETALNLPHDIEFKAFIRVSRQYMKEPFSLLVNDTNLPPDTSLRFTKNLIQNDC